MHLMLAKLLIIFVGVNSFRLVEGSKCFEFHQGINAVHSLIRNGKADIPPHIFYFGSFSSYEPCEEACRQKPECEIWTWHTNEFGNHWKTHCAGRDSHHNTWVTQEKMVSGSLIPCPYESNITWTKSEPNVILEDDDFAQCLSTANISYSLHGEMSVWWPDIAKDNIVIELTFWDHLAATCDLRDVVVGKLSTNPIGCLILKSCDIITGVPINEKCSYNCSCDSNPCNASIVIGPRTVSDNINVCKIE